MRACARANGATRSCPQAASGITPAPPPSTDPPASRRSVTPISRGHANALGFQHPGAFRFRRSQRIHRTIKRDCIALPKHPGIAGPRQGKPRRRMDALHLDASVRAATDAIAHELAPSTRRQCASTSNGPQRRGFHRPPGARGTAVAYAEGPERCLRERTKAQRSSSGACRWPPVRIRFVHHWIAQMVRASDC